jgi:hypothetical protein
LLPFGHQATSVSSASRTVTLMSVGTAPVSISNVYPSGDFFVTGNSCAGLLEPGRSCAVTLSFNPAAAGDRHGTATVVSNAPGSPATVFLTGTGVPGNGILVASVPNLHFGETPIGRTGAVQTVTLSASGGPLVLGSVRVAGSSPADFSITSDTCTGASLAQGSACTVSIAFSPTVTGLRSASLEIQGAAGAAAASVPLDGTGIAAPAAEGIPTLGEWGLGIFALALAAAGVGFLGRRA